MREPRPASLVGELAAEGQAAHVADECWHFPRGPNAKVQGRALGVAEVIVRIGVPCNAQLGAAVVNGSLAMFGPIGEHFAEEGQFSL